MFTCMSWWFILQDQDLYLFQIFKIWGVLLANHADIMTHILNPIHSFLLPYHWWTGKANPVVLILSCLPLPFPYPWCGIWLHFLSLVKNNMHVIFSRMRSCWLFETPKTPSKSHFLTSISNRKPGKSQGLRNRKAKTYPRLSECFGKARKSCGKPIFRGGPMRWVSRLLSNNNDTGESRAGLTCVLEI